MIVPGRSTAIFVLVVSICILLSCEAKKKKPESECPDELFDLATTSKNECIEEQKGTSVSPSSTPASTGSTPEEDTEEPEDDEDTSSPPSATTPGAPGSSPEPSGSSPESSSPETPVSSPETPASSPGASASSPEVPASSPSAPASTASPAATTEAASTAPARRRRAARKSKSRRARKEELKECFFKKMAANPLVAKMEEECEEKADGPPTSPKGKKKLQKCLTNALKEECPGILGRDRSRRHTRKN